MPCKVNRPVYIVWYRTCSSSTYHPILTHILTIGNTPLTALQPQCSTRPMGKRTERAHLKKEHRHEAAGSRLNTLASVTKKVKRTIMADLSLNGMDHDPSIITVETSGELGFPKYVIGTVCLSDIHRGTGISLPGISRIFAGNRRPTLENAILIADYIRRRTRRKFGVEDLVRLINKRTKRTCATDSANSDVKQDEEDAVA